MRTRRTSPEHQQAVARWLAQLSAEMDTARTDRGSERPEPQGEWWAEHTAVGVEPALGVVPAATASPEAGAPAVPVPGRHAARRRPGAGRASLLPEPLRGHAALGPGPLAVVAVVAAVGLAVTAWLVVRDDPEPPSLSAAPATGGPPLVAPDPGEAAASGPGGGEAPLPGAGGATPAAAGSVTVDVAGDVRRPGITVLDAGARVVDAIEAAGGPRRGVDLSTLNLARVLVDGEQIVVGATAAAPQPVPGLGAPGATPGGALVNINTASAAELETLPEVGPVTAAAIIEWRETNGGFTAVEELLEVDGIGEATLGQMAPHVTV